MSSGFPGALASSLASAASSIATFDPADLVALEHGCRQLLAAISDCRASRDNLLSLPTDLTVRIFSFCDASTLSALDCTSHALRTPVGAGGRSLIEMAVCDAASRQHGDVISRLMPRKQGPAARLAWLEEAREMASSWGDTCSSVHVRLEDALDDENSEMTLRWLQPPERAVSSDGCRALLSAAVLNTLATHASDPEQAHEDQGLWPAIQDLLNVVALPQVGPRLCGREVEALTLALVEVIRQQSARGFAVPRRALETLKQLGTSTAPRHFQHAARQAEAIPLLVDLARARTDGGSGGGGSSAGAGGGGGGGGDGPIASQSDGVPDVVLALGMLCSASPQSQAEAAAAGVLPLLVSLLHPTADEESALAAAATLSELASGTGYAGSSSYLDQYSTAQESSAIQDAARAAGAIPALVKRLSLAGTGSVTDAAGDGSAAAAAADGGGSHHFDIQLPPYPFHGPLHSVGPSVGGAATASVAAVALSNLCCANLANQDAAHEAGAMPLLIVLLRLAVRNIERGTADERQDEQNAAYAAATTIGSLVVNNPSRQAAAREAGALGLLVQLLRTAPPATPLHHNELQSPASSVAFGLGNLCMENPANQLAARKAVPLLCQRLALSRGPLGPEDEVTVIDAASALAKLTMGCPDNQAAALRAGAVSKLVKLLSEGPGFVVANAAFALHHVCDRNAQNQRCALRAGAIAQLVRLLDASGEANRDKERAAADVALAFEGLCEGNAHNQDAARDAGAIDALVRAMGRGAERMRGCTVEGLCSLTLRHAENQRAAVDAGAVPLLLTMLDPADEPSTSCAAYALKLLCAASVEARAQAEAGVGVLVKMASGDVPTPSAEEVARIEAAHGPLLSFLDRVGVDERMASVASASSSSAASSSSLSPGEPPSAAETARQARYELADASSDALGCICAGSAAARAAVVQAELVTKCVRMVAASATACASASAPASPPDTAPATAAAGGGEANSDALLGACVLSNLTLLCPELRSAAVAAGAVDALLGLLLAPGGSVRQRDDAAAALGAVCHANAAAQDAAHAGGALGAVLALLGDGTSRCAAYALRQLVHGNAASLAAARDAGAVGALITQLEAPQTEHGMPVAAAAAGAAAAVAGLAADTQPPLDGKATVRATVQMAVRQPKVGLPDVTGDALSALAALLGDASGGAARQMAEGGLLRLLAPLAEAGYVYAAPGCESAASCPCAPPSQLLPVSTLISELRQYEAADGTGPSSRAAESGGGSGGGGGGGSGPDVDGAAPMVEDNEAFAAARPKLRGTPSAKKRKRQLAGSA